MGTARKGIRRIGWWILGVAIGLAPGRLEIMAWASPSAAGSWESWTVSWRGEAQEVRIYRPAGFPAHAPYPVIYLLSGWAMGLGMWDRTDLEQAADAAHVMLVAVQGEDGEVPSYYSIYSGLPWPQGSAWEVSFYDWFFQGVLPWVERRYPVRRDPGGRALVGFSMGGKGAFSLAAHRPDRFAAAVSIAGVLDLTRHDSTALRAVYGPPGADPLRVGADNPMELAVNLKGLTLLIFHGGADPEVHPAHSRRMHEALEALAYPHHWEEIPGLGHEVSSLEIARIFEYLVPIFRGARSIPYPWSYRFAMARSRTVYGMTMARTRADAWSEVREVTPQGFVVRTEDALTVITPVWYPVGSRVRVEVFDEQTGAQLVRREVRAIGGRLRLDLPAGHWRVAFQLIRPRPDLRPASPNLLGRMSRKPLCPWEDLICYSVREP